MALGILIPQLGIKPVPLAVEVQSLNHWTAREVPILYYFKLVRVVLLKVEFIYIKKNSACEFKTVFSQSMGCDCIRIHEIHGFPLIACDPLCLQITDFVEQHQENLIMTGGKGLKMKKKVVSKG